jgi:hypothetical protein
VGLGAAIAVIGLVTGGLGTGLALADATASVAAATVSVCGTSAPLLPGSSGSCRESFASPYGTQPVAVTLTMSSSASSGTAVSSSGVGTEALLDGTATGLQVQVIDDATGKLFLISGVRCYAGPGSDVPAVYPDAGYCTSRQTDLVVGSFRSTGDHTQTFTVRWLLPVSAGNPYQGGEASVTLQPTFTDLSSGSPAGGVLGQSTTSPSPSGTPAGGVLGAHTPTTGAGLPVLLSRVLIVLGLGLFLGGLWYVRRQRYPSASPGIR